MSDCSFRYMARLFVSIFASFMSLPSAHAEAEALYALQVINYSCAAGLVILLYDHLLTFGDEVRLIWSAKSSTTKFMFLATRYLVPSLMILNAVGKYSNDRRALFFIELNPGKALSGLSDVHLSDDIFAGSITQAINSWLVLLRLWILWQRQRTFILCTLLLFIATELATIIGGWIGVAHILPGMFFEPTLHLCAFKGQFSIFFLRIPGLVFQFVVLAALAWKALRHGQTSLSSIYRDGFVYFLFLFAFGVMSVIFCFVPPNFLAFTALFFIWCFTTITTCRMILNIRRTSNEEPPYRLSWFGRA
ncbi:hypothetical protein C8J57DRAFT_1734428 [Mycena rebaudengoi]|nr:hypothetical protein C8J57DRAFT_1734428 [Mycena rebaudengoi]